MANINVGDLVTLVCCGDIATGKNILSGDTSTLQVTLVPAPGPGTTWLAVDGTTVGAGGSPGSICLQLTDPTGINWYLNGLTATSGVNLTNPSAPSYSGIYWLSADISTSYVFLVCLGVIPGNRYCDGRTATATVALAPQTGWQIGADFTGTLWVVQK